MGDRPDSCVQTSGAGATSRQWTRPQRLSRTPHSLWMLMPAKRVHHQGSGQASSTGFRPGRPRSLPLRLGPPSAATLAGVTGWLSCCDRGQRRRPDWS